MGMIVASPYVPCSAFTMGLRLPDAKPLQGIVHLDRYLECASQPGPDITPPRLLAFVRNGSPEVCDLKHGAILNST